MSDNKDNKCDSKNKETIILEYLQEPMMIKKGFNDPTGTKPTKPTAENLPKPTAKTTETKKD